MEEFLLVFTKVFSIYQMIYTYILLKFNLKFKKIISSKLVSHSLKNTKT